MSAFVKTFVEDRIQHIILSRVDKKNALTQDMYGAVADAIVAAEADDGVRSILLYGDGGVFTAGNDLQDFLKVRGTPFSDLPIEKFMYAIIEAEKPIVAAVEGLAIGIGVTMLLNFDLVYADPEAKFSVPFVNIALSPEFRSSETFPAMVGRLKASEIILLGEMFSAAEAASYGFVNKVSEPGKAITLAKEKALALANKAPASVKASKALLKGDVDEMKALIQREFKIVDERVADTEIDEAVTAFMEKRAPDFSKF